jgi:ribonuclease PH
VVRDDGAALAACVNAACAAAVDAGVPLSGMLGARSCDELAR